MNIEVKGGVYPTMITPYKDGKIDYETCEKLVEWYWNGFRGIVVDASDNSIFFAGDELRVHFDDSTEILLDDGTVMVFNTKESDTNAIGWKDGTIVTVKFATYEEDRTLAIANYVEVKK